MLSSKHFPFWLLTIATFIALPGFTLIQDGMFMDAMLYTSVAHNQAHDFGTFWFPQFSKLNLGIPGFNSFHEQPPLAFGIESVFFRIFGDNMYVERFYVFLCACITAFLIHYLWRLIFRKNGSLKAFSWFPVFLWITTPSIYWAASNNVNENTMGIFTLLAVIFTFKAFIEKRNNWLKISFAGIFIFLATFTKGFPGFFPLCVPLLYFVSTRKISFKTTLLYSFILLIIPLGIYGILFKIPVSHDSLSIYLFKRALARISDNPTTSNRFESLISLFSDLIPQLGLMLILFVIASFKKIKYHWVAEPKLILFFSFVGLTGSAPLMLTMVQKAFYLIPCYPFFAIASAMVLLPLLLAFYERMQTASNAFKVFRTITVVLLVGAISLVAMMKGKDGRDETLLHDVRIVSKLIPKHGEIMITTYAFSFEWELQCYLMRYYFISCDFNPTNPDKYFIIDKNEKPDRDLSAYQLQEIGLQRYKLYKLKGS